MPSTTKKRKPRFLIAKADDVGPTPERRLKEDYDDLTLRGTKLRERTRQNTVKALYDAGDIGADALNAAQWWYADYIFSTVGHLDLMQECLPENYLRGDVHTYAISRGHAGARISRVRERLGFCAHVRLELMLAREMSFSAMAGHLFPDLASSTARMKIASQCSLVLEQLAASYQRRKNSAGTCQQKMLEDA